MFNLNNIQNSQNSNSLLENLTVLASEIDHSIEIRHVTHQKGSLKFQVSQGQNTKNVTLHLPGLKADSLVNGFKNEEMRHFLSTMIKVAAFQAKHVAATYTPDSTSPLSCSKYAISLSKHRKSLAHVQIELGLSEKLGAKVRIKFKGKKAYLTAKYADSKRENRIELPRELLSSPEKLYGISTNADLMEMLKFNGKKGKRTQFKCEELISLPQTSPNQDNDCPFNQFRQSFDESLFRATEEVQIIVENTSKKLGNGAFGEVYLATFSRKEYEGEKIQSDRFDGALKTIQKNHSSLNEMEAEYNVHRRISSKRSEKILQVLGRCDEGIVLEYCSGGALVGAKNDYSLLSNVQFRQSPIGVASKRLVSLAKDIAQGIGHLHKTKVIHCDIAGRNILLADKENPQAKVSDFGLSKIVEDVKVGGDFAPETNLPIRWAAPEMLLKDHYSEKSDVWMFGITLWEILMAERPYSHLTQDDIGTQLARGEAPELLMPNFDRMDPLTREVCVLIKKCTLWDPALRPTMTEVNKVLARIQKMEQSGHHSATISERPGRASDHPEREESYVRSPVVTRSQGSSDGDYGPLNS